MKEVKDLYTKSKKYSSKVLKKTEMNGNTSYVCELENLILLSVAIIPKLIYEFNTLPNKIPADSLPDY